MGFLLGFGYREIQAEVRAKREAKKKDRTYAICSITEACNQIRRLSLDPSMENFIIAFL